MKKEKICTKCYCSTLGKTPGSFLTELILWVLFFPAGFIYTCWRSNNKGMECPYCNSRTMIPLDSPRGKELTKK